MEQELRDRWTSLAGSGREPAAALAGLLARYREPHRRYHGLAHIVRVLRDVDDLLGLVPVDDPDAVRFAAWYHDAVYDSTSAGAANEEASALLAGRALTALEQPPARVEAVQRLVRATARHESTAPDEAVLLDADLAVLAAEPATYAAYARGVRREYGHVGDEDWRQGRAAVLRSFLDRDVIFATAPMRARDAIARANLAAELAGLVAPTDGDHHSGLPPTMGGTLPGMDAPDTVVEALDELRAAGYTIDFQIGPDALACPSCGSDHPVGDLVADHVYRFEGNTDPGDEAIVIGVTCPSCGAKGVLVSAYGPEAEPDELTGIVMIAQRYAG